VELTTILIQQPDGAKNCLTIERMEGEPSAVSAARVARDRKLPVGTMLVVSQERWGVTDEHGSVDLFQVPDGGYMPGDSYRPKDPRRKSGFRIKAIEGDKVIADDGRTIQIDRMKRYVRVG